MNIIRRKSDNIVLYAANDLYLVESECRGNGWVDATNTNANCELLTVDEIPNNFKGGSFIYDGTWTLIDNDLLNKLKEDKQVEIRDAFELESDLPVDAEGYTWNGGLNSAFIINGLAEVIGFRSKAQGTIHDKTNRPRTMNATTMKNVAANIEEAYQVKFVKKQSLLVQIEEATTTSEVEAIKW